ncbi:MAG: NHL repeat-containing protein [candidate division Zixibacteria bacterium]|nr:NHL repeat-containing protein [candidate division Zixibacteria bacterium]
MPSADSRTNGLQFGCIHGAGRQIATAIAVLTSSLVFGCAGSRSGASDAGFTGNTTFELAAVYSDTSLQGVALSPPHTGETESFLASPVSIAPAGASRSGSLIIADRQSGRVIQIGDNGAVIRDAVVTGNGHVNSSRTPRVIRLDFGGSLYIADGVTGRVQTYDTQWRHGADITPPYAALGIVEGSITGLALGAFGETYLVDGSNARLYRFDASGRFLSSFGGEEYGWARLSRPAGAACGANDGSVYVCDPGLSRVVVFDNAGIPQRSFGEGDLAEPVAVALDGHGLAYIADRKSKMVFIYDSSGRLVGRIDSASVPAAVLQGPTDVAVADSMLYVADPPSGRVLKILMHNPGH